MRLFVKFVLLGIVGVCSVVLSGCSFIWTTENGDPATPEDIKSSVEKEFSVVHPNLVLQSSVVEKEKPFQRNVYVFYDESNGISFTTNSVVKRPTLPAPGGERKNDADFAYADAYLNHLNGRVSNLTKQYGMQTATVDEQHMLMDSKLKRRAGQSDVSLFDEGEFIFVDDTVKGADMVAVLKGIYNLYSPNNDKHLLSA